MSTYTDLRNRVKENLEVGYNQNDRITLQKVRFYNAENEYWGTFVGDVFANKLQLSSTTLFDTTLISSRISSETGVMELSGLVPELSSLRAENERIRSELGQAYRQISSVMTSDNPYDYELTHVASALICLRNSLSVFV